MGREMFTDSDHFTVTFKEDRPPPQQKAAFMGSMFLSDYILQLDHGMVRGVKLKITLFNCYCGGANLPATIVLDFNNNGGGAPPDNQTIER